MNCIFRRVGQTDSITIVPSAKGLRECLTTHKFLQRENRKSKGCRLVVCAGNGDVMILMDVVY